MACVVGGTATLVPEKSTYISAPDTRDNKEMDDAMSLAATPWRHRKCFDLSSVAGTASVFWSAWDRLRRALPNESSTAFAIAVLRLSSI